MLHVFLDWDIFYDHHHLHSEPFLTGIIDRMKLFKFNEKSRILVNLKNVLFDKLHPEKDEIKNRLNISQVALAFKLFKKKIQIQFKLKY